MCKTILSKIFQCNNLAVLSQLCVALACFHRICSYYCKLVSNTKIRKDKFFETKYNPHHPPTVQTDCFKYLAELRDFCVDVTPFVDDIEKHEDIMHLHRIAFVMSRFLQDFLLANPVFHATPQPYFGLRKRKRSNWEY